MREMSLIELINSIPETHIARKEYIKFLGRLSKEKNERCQLEQEVEKLQQENKELKANMEIVADMATKDNLGRYFHVAARTKGSLAEHDKNNLIAFVSDVNETGQFGWTDCQWLTDYVEEYMEQLKDSNNE